MDDKSLVLRESSELVNRSKGLAKRGLEFIDELRQVELVISEAEILPFIQRNRKIKNNIGRIPDEFLNRKTANPHDVTAFDLNIFLVIFDQIRIRRGYVLDYVYAFDGHYGGEPIIYARESSSSPITSTDEFYDKFLLPRPEMLLGAEPNHEDSLPYLPCLEFERTPMGYFQFALFCMTVRRFYLYWHSNYNDRKYILTKSRLDHFVQDRIGGISPHEVDLLKSVDTSPRVKITNKSARVSVLNFEENIGYSRLHIYLKHPNFFDRLEDELIIKNHVTRLY
jgi:hypothetical protein